MLTFCGRLPQMRVLELFQAPSGLLLETEHASANQPTNSSTTTCEKTDTTGVIINHRNAFGKHAHMSQKQATSGTCSTSSLNQTQTRKKCLPVPVGAKYLPLVEMFTNFPEKSSQLRCSRWIYYLETIDLCCEHVVDPHKSESVQGKTMGNST